MCGSMADIQSAAAETRPGKKKKKKKKKKEKKEQKYNVRRAAIIKSESANASLMPMSALYTCEKLSRGAHRWTCH